MRRSMFAGLKADGFFKAVQALLGKFLRFPVCFNRYRITMLPIASWVNPRRSGEQDFSDLISRPSLRLIPICMGIF